MKIVVYDVEECKAIINSWLDKQHQDKKQIEFVRPWRILKVKGQIGTGNFSIKYIAFDEECYEYFEGEKMSGIVPCDDDCEEWGAS